MPFSLSIGLKVNMIVQLEFKLAYYDVTVKQISFYAIGSPPQIHIGAVCISYTLHTFWKGMKSLFSFLISVAQLPGAAEYTNWISAEM